jgi:hypothetical protein
VDWRGAAGKAGEVGHRRRRSKISGGHQGAGGG